MGLRYILHEHPFLTAGKTLVLLTAKFLKAKLVSILKPFVLLGEQC